MSTSRTMFVTLFGMLMATLLLASGCDSLKSTLDKARMKLVGVTVTNPERESAEWVLKQAIEAARDKNAERGWEKFQKILHSSEQSPNALRGWYTGAWKRLGRQVEDYILEDGVSFKIVDYKEVMSSTGQLVGLDYYIVSRKKEMPTPCAVYRDDEKGGKWRIRRCSL